MRRRLRPVVSFIVILNLKLFTLITRRERARVLVVNEYDEVLLIQAYVSHGHWSLPGGALKRRESATAAARRELHEETGIVVREEDLTYLTTLGKPDTDISFQAPLFRVQVSKKALPKTPANPREIVEVGWYKRDQLPDPLSLIVLAALEIDNPDKG